jgi:hypothetical protein
MIFFPCAMTLGSNVIFSLRFTQTIYTRFTDIAKGRRSCKSGVQVIAGAEGKAEVVDGELAHPSGVEPETF